MFSEKTKHKRWNFQRITDRFARTTKKENKGKINFHICEKFSFQAIMNIITFKPSIEFEPSKNKNIQPTEAATGGVL